MPALVALLLMLGITLLIFLEARKRAHEHDQQLFALRKEQVRTTIERRLYHYIQILKGGKGFLTASDTVTREEWRHFIEILDLEKNYPGIQGVGYTIAIKPHQLHYVENKVRAGGFSNFEVVPAGKRPFYTSILLIEPFSGRNLRAFGYDMWSEPTRRTAMQRAADTNAPSLSGRITLVQEYDHLRQPGFLLYLPVYKTIQPPVTIAERRNQLKGFVYSPFRAGDLFSALISTDFNDLDIEVYDGVSSDSATLLFDRVPEIDYFSIPDTETKKARLELKIAGQTWTIFVATLPQFTTSQAQGRPFLLLTALIVISFLIFFIIISLLNKRKSNQLKQIITDNATAALFMMDARGYCTFMNPAAEEMTGFTLEEMRQKPLHEMIHHHYPDGRPYPMQKCPINKALGNHKSLRAYEDVFIRKDGTFIDVSCAVSPIYQNGQPESTVLEVRDITEIKEAEQKVKENTERLQKVFYHVPAIVGLISATELMYVLANPMFMKLFGNRPLLGLSVEEAHPEFTDKVIISQIRKVIQTGTAQVGNEVELKINRNNTQELIPGYFNYVFEPIFDDEQRVESVLIFAVEVTELVKSRETLTLLNQELLETNKELKRINIDLDNFVYVASHDLKSPITNIEGLTNALLENLDQKQDTEEGQLLIMLQASVNKLRETVQELTEITKIQKQASLAAETLDFAEVTQNVLTDLQQNIAETNAQITTHFAAPQLRYARKDLRSILYNLIANAIRYSSPDRQPSIQITTFYEHDKVVLTVQDNGLGIAKNQQHKLFSMFTRLHQHIEGSGTGLYIVKRIIENNGGRIEVESEPGVGSIFRVRF